MKSFYFPLATAGLAFLAFRISAATLYVDVNSTNPMPPFASWTTAANTIQDAVNAATNDDLILVTNGIYQVGGGVDDFYGDDFSIRVLLGTPLTVCSVNGPAVTVILGSPLSGSASGVRCVNLADGATLSGFTLANGGTMGDYDWAWWLGDNRRQIGGGVSCGGPNALITNCVITGCVAHLDGGGASGGTLKNCTLVNNTAGGSGAGAQGSALTNCVLFGNIANKGGGLANGVAVNCTFVGNYAASAGGAAETATLANCIVYHNFALTQREYDGGVLNFCCTQTLPPTGSGNITNEPALADFAHLSTDSPCRGAGSTNYSSGVDIDGELWLNPPSIGCDEFYPGSVTGALAVAVSADYTNAAAGFVVNLVGTISGHASLNVWDFGDGTIVSNRLYASHSWAAAGDYPVTFTAFNNDNPGGVSASVVIHVLQDSICYVSLASANPVWPFSSWATAATNIQDAVAAAAAGGTVWVTNGDYNIGGRVVFGAMTNRVAVNKPITLTSVNGPAVTAIEGFTTNDNVSDIRCVYLTNYAVLIGFALTNGATIQGGDYIREWDGAGVSCEPLAVVSNCWFINNTAQGDGGGVYGGTIFNCGFTNNYGYNGGGAMSASLTDCALANNQSYNGGGACDSSLTGCTLTGNFTYFESEAPDSGGGTSGCALTNCVLTKNSSNNGGGASGCTLNNCVLAGNSAGNGGGGANSSTFVNCTVVGNNSGNGGGVASSALTNCIVWFNTAPSATNYSDDCVFFYCDTSPMPTNGANNITIDPLFADSFHISSASPCRGAGIFSATSGVDIDGDAWLNPPSIGADEFNASSATGALAVAFSETFTNVTAGFTIDFAAQISGHATANVWNYGDGTVVSNELFMSHTWSAPGDYTVTFSAFNTDNPAGVTASVTIFVLQNPVHYVSPDSADPVLPYLSWATAATNIQDAVDAAFAGGTIIVSNGIYQTGVTILYGSMTNRVAVTKPLTLQSVNGAAATVIDGGGAIRCLYLTNHVSVTGFTLQNGLGNNGGGVFCEAYDDILNDCVLASNSCPFDWTSGGGTYRGILNRCTLTGNWASYQGGAAVYAGLNWCAISNNGPAAYGGAGHQCTFVNCLIISNHAAWGGGIVNCEADNCLLVGNYASYAGGGSYYGPLNNCTIVNNTVATGPGTYGGGGAYDGSANNCIIYYNNGGNCGADYTGALSLNHCCTDAGGLDNISDPPLFVNLAAGDFHLQSNSPCINAGNNAFVVGTNDLDGLARVAGGMVDIGAYEFQNPTSVISYAWLMGYGFPTDGAADYADSDHDGMNNWQEWIAGTDPNNASSLLKLLPAVSTNGPAGFVVTWQSVSDRTYFVQRSGNLAASPAFSSIQTNIVGQAGTTSWTDTTATNAGPYFYRVGVQ